MGRKREDRIGYIIPDDPLTKALERPEVQEALMRVLLEMMPVQKPSPERHSTVGGD